MRSLICTTISVLLGRKHGQGELHVRAISVRVVGLQMVLKDKGLDEMTMDVSVWLKKRRSSRQSPDVVQHLEVQKRRI